MTFTLQELGKHDLSMQYKAKAVQGSHDLDLTSAIDPRSWDGQIGAGGVLPMTSDTAAWWISLSSTAP